MSVAGLLSLISRLNNLPASTKTSLGPNLIRAESSIISPMDKVNNQEDTNP